MPEEVAKRAVSVASAKPVSYTHLDVYKRQPLHYGVLSSDA